MRACATVSAVVLGLSIAGMTIVACSSGGGAPQPPPQPDNSAAPVSTPAPPTGTATPTTSAPPNDDEADFGRCRQVMQTANGPGPDGGVVMNNATTAADAGSSDRFDVSKQLYFQKRDAYRCCFELWGKKNVGQRGKVDLYVKLDKTGTVNDVHIKPNSELKDARVEKCMDSVTRSITYPPSPAGKFTEFDLPFDFKPVR